MARARIARLGVLLGFVAMPVSASARPVDAPGGPQEGPADLTVFVGRGCPHCARALDWLEAFRTQHPGVRVEVLDVVQDSAALARLARLSRVGGLGGVTVPTFVVHDEIVEVGFDAPATTGARLADRLAGGRDPPEAPAVDLPLVGEIRLEEVGLPPFTVAMGLLDGFNPCAMWVLLFLLSMLVNVRSRRRMLLIGGVFVLVSGVVYYAFMAAWLSVFRLLGAASWIQVGLGALALLLGGLNVRDAVGKEWGPVLAIPDRAKPGIYARVRRIVSAERMAPALGTVVVLALFVNTVELLCTAGLPALYTRILTLRDLSAWGYHGYLLLYNVCYMLDDALILTVAVATLGHHRLQQREARGLKLLSGAVMVGLGCVLLLRPGWLAG